MLSTCWKSLFTYARYGNMQCVYGTFPFKFNSSVKGLCTLDNIKYKYKGVKMSLLFERKKKKDWHCKTFSFKRKRNNAIATITD